MRGKTGGGVRLTDSSTPSQGAKAMAFPDLAVNAIYTILCLVPGFISVKTLTYIGDLDADMSEFEKSTWSFIASGVSLSATYFVYVTWTTVTTGRFVLIRSLDITWIEVVTIYPVLLLVAAVVGYLSAKVFDRTLGNPTSPRPENVQ